MNARAASWILTAGTKLAETATSATAILCVHGQGKTSTIKITPLEFNRLASIPGRLFFAINFLVHRLLLNRRCSSSIGFELQLQLQLQLSPQIALAPLVKDRCSSKNYPEADFRPALPQLTFWIFSPTSSQASATAAPLADSSPPLPWSVSTTTSI
jgi:hypothetical protein